MPTYKLTYFNLGGRGEAIRLILALAGQKFEDKRVSFEEWPALKPQTPMGGLPMLEVDGVVLSQSMAILRYLAKQFGYAGKTDLEAAQIDMVGDCIVDILTAAVAFVYSHDEAQKAVLEKKFKDETLPNTLQTLEKQLNGQEWFVGKSLSWADVYLYTVLETNLTQEMKVSVPWEKAPNLQKLVQRVGEQPNIKAWQAQKH